MSAQDHDGIDVGRIYTMTATGETYIVLAVLTDTVLIRRSPTSRRETLGCSITNFRKHFTRTHAPGDGLLDLAAAVGVVADASRPAGAQPMIEFTAAPVHPALQAALSDEVLACHLALWTHQGTTDGGDPQ